MPCATEIDRLRAVLSAMTPRPWQPEHPRAEEPGGWVVSRAGAVEADVLRGAGPEDTRGIVALANVAPGLLACIDSLAAIRTAALADLDHYRQGAAGGQVAHLPTMTPTQAAQIERETRSLDALAARIREALPEASRG